MNREELRAETLRNLEAKRRSQKDRIIAEIHRHRQAGSRPKSLRLFLKAANVPASTFRTAAHFEGLRNDVYDLVGRQLRERQAIYEAKRWQNAIAYFRKNVDKAESYAAIARKAGIPPSKLWERSQLADARKDEARPLVEECQRRQYEREQRWLQVQADIEARAAEAYRELQRENRRKYRQFAEKRSVQLMKQRLHR